MNCENGSNNWLKALLIGAMAGAIGGLILAPQSGKETQKKLKDEAQKLQDDLDKLYSDITDKAESMKKDLEKKLNEITKLEGKT